MIATVVSGIIFILLSYVSQLVFPSNQFADVDSGSTDVMLAAGGQFLNTFFTAAYVAGALGSALTSQASVARILFAMGRDGILPRKVFGHVSARFSTPVYAILVGQRDLAAGHLDRSGDPRVGRQFRCAGGLLGGEPVGDQALLRRHAGTQRAAQRHRCRRSASCSPRGCGPACPARR